MEKWLVAGVFALLSGVPSAFANFAVSRTAIEALNGNEVIPNVTYVVASNYEAKLDIYKRRDVSSPRPTLLYIHGGGWIIGEQEAALMSIMPWLEMGWNVVNVEYRLGRVAPPPPRSKTPSAPFASSPFRRKPTTSTSGASSSPAIRREGIWRWRRE